MSGSVDVQGSRRLLKTATYDVCARITLARKIERTNRQAWEDADKVCEKAKLHIVGEDIEFKSLPGMFLANVRSPRPFDPRLRLQGDELQS